MSGLLDTLKGCLVYLVTGVLAWAELEWWGGNPTELEVHEVIFVNLVLVTTVFVLLPCGKSK